MVTIKEIAEVCGLSVASVSKALNGKSGVSPERAKQVQQVAAELGYFPNTLAQSLRTNRSNTIGVLFKNTLVHEYFGEVLEAIREEAESKKFDITFLSNCVDEANGYYEFARRRQCDGVILVQGDFDSENINPLIESDIPVVSIDHIYDNHTAVLSDNVNSTQSIISYLVKRGHERIAIIHGEEGNVTKLRMAGFYRGCEQYGIKVPDEYVVAGRYREMNTAREATRKLMALPERPTCILYPDDISCLGGIAQIEEMGFSVPRDISCVGYDGIYLTSYFKPRMTTFRQDTHSIGKAAASELIRAIEDPKSYAPQVISITGHVQEGGTVARID